MLHRVGELLKGTPERENTVKEAEKEVSTPTSKKSPTRARDVAAGGSVVRNLLAQTPTKVVSDAARTAFITPAD